MKKPNKKTLALTIVAFVLVLMSLVSFTFSWIDDIKLVEFQNDDLAKNGAPLKTGTDINASVNITKTDNTIDLGNMLTNSDLTYEYTENGETKKHIKYDTSSPDATKNPDTDDINEKKGYFYESGDMHLSGCYSDGEKFYFPRQGQSGYREGNKDDENVNYISFTTKVSSPNANVDFWFRNEPAIYESGTNTKITNARYAIIVDGQAHVYSSTGTANTCNANLNGTTAVQGVRKTSTYTYNHADNTTSERGKNSNTLFSIKKGDTVNMTVKIWLESGFGSTITASDINLQLVSSWAYTRKLWIDDKTTNGNGGSWLNDASAKLYVTFPEFLKDLPSVSDWANASSGFYSLTVDGSTHKGYVEVPLVYNIEKMILYRCNSTYWNNHSNNDPPARSEYNVHCWNWWRTYTPNTYVDETYTLYGGSMDSTANGYFNSIGQGFTVTNKGYGTWGSVEEIKVFSHYNNSDLASKGDGKAMYVVDHSDGDTSGETYIYEMYRSGTTSSDPWKTYVPAGSAKIQFRYFGGASGLSWGYSSWNGENPQRRPLASSGLYSYNATEYQLAAIFSNVNGWGYWRDTHSHEYDKVYFVKKGSTYAYANNVYAYMYDDNNHYNAQWKADEGKYGYQMTRMKDANNNDVNWSDNSSWVMQSDSARPGSNIFNHLIFNDGGSNQTAELKVFPGCFYNADDGKWYGTINDNGRDASSSSGGGSGGGESTGGGGTIDGFTIESDFTIQANNNTYTVYQNSAGTEFKARVALTTGSNSNWTTVQKNGTNYGLEQSGQSYDVPSTTINLYLVSGRTNNFRLNASSAGNYIITFEYQDGNTGTIRVSSVLKES